MGKTILDLAHNKEEFNIIAGICSNANSFCNSKYEDLPVFNNFKEILTDNCYLRPDVIVDFSTPKMLDDLLTFATNNKIPVVIGTTGYSKEQIDKIKITSNEIPIFLSGNMSIGVNLLIKACKNISSIIKDDCDIEIIEKHHRNKKDAPSGTALMIADAITKELGISNMDYLFSRNQIHRKRKKSEIGISSVRAGTIVGEHCVVFGLDGETITVTHNAESRDVFAKGALMAVDFIIKKVPGLYNMENLCDCGICY